MLLDTNMETDSYATLAARLASFEAAVPLPLKKRVSTAKPAKPIAWPHKTPSAAQLAQAGFYFKPTSSSRDNAVCFLCESALDGWENDDDPIEEHLKHSGDCAWATLMKISQDEHDPSTMEDPTNEEMTKVRRTTFAFGWPHDSKRGWVCKTDKMVTAGWYFAPTPESEDFVSCAYCKLSLDGWEPKDNPFEEHHRRSPDCLFFTFAGTIGKKAVRKENGRTSKTSRMSTQSNQPIETESQTIPDLDESIDTSTLSVMSVMSTAGQKKNGRGKKKASKNNAAEPIPTVEIDSSVTEIQPPVQATQAHRERKRRSDQISEDRHGERESTVRPEPPAKRRNTRSRDSVLRDADSQLEQNDLGATTDEAPKKGRKRASSTTRKVSAASTAALRAGISQVLPDDATIDAALEADLNRPLSDVEDLATVEPEKPKRGRSKKATASTAPVRSKKVAHEEEVVEAEIIPNEMEDVSHTAANENDVESKNKSRKGRVTKKTITKKVADSNRSSLASNITVEIPALRAANASILTARTLEDDSGHETDASMQSKSMTRKPSKRKAAAKGRPRKAASRVVSKTVDTVPVSQPENSAVTALAAAAEPLESFATAMEADRMDIDEKIAELEKEIEEEDAAPKKAGRPAKGGKAKNTKLKGKKDKMAQLSMPGAFSPIIIESAEPSFTSALSPNSPPLKSNLGQTVSAPPLDDEMETRSPVEQSTPTPRRVAPPAIPPRSPARPSPTPRSALPRPKMTPTGSVLKHSVAAGTPSPERSPTAQSSDAENAPPSSLPQSARPPLAPITISPIKRVELAAPGTPTTARRIGVGMLSPNKIGGGLKSEAPWTSVDVEIAFQNTPGKDKENLFGKAGGLTAAERGMSVEGWIRENAKRAEEELRREGERAVGVFELEGARALRALEGVVLE